MRERERRDWDNEYNVSEIEKEKQKENLKGEMGQRKERRVKDYIFLFY